MERGVRIPKQRAEAAKNELQDDGVLDTSLQPVTQQDHIVFPVTDDYKGETVEASFESFTTTTTFREAVTPFLTDEEQEVFIHSYDSVGSIAIIQVPDELAEKEDAIGQALLDAQPSIRTVRSRNTERGGQQRLRTTKHLAGEDTTKTVHVEHGVELVVDVDAVYFSPRLSTERARIANMVGAGEDVLVMFSGCAPYPCVIAEKSEAASITGVEINDAGHRLGVENVGRNGFENRVSLHQGDVADVVPGLGVFDRVVMPAPHNATDYVDLGKRVVRDQGVLHVYAFVKNGDHKTFDELSVENTVVCGDRSPSEQRVCYDVVLSEHR
jgi:tRNA (guanine37-N1)-methyltransferase